MNFIARILKSGGNKLIKTRLFVPAGISMSKPSMGSSGVWYFVNQSSIIWNISKTYFRYQ